MRSERVQILETIIVHEQTGIVHHGEANSTNTMKLSAYTILAFTIIEQVSDGYAEQEALPHLRRSLEGCFDPARTVTVPGDLDVRFNKIPCNNPPDGLFPLKAEDYPISDETANILKNQSEGVSIVKDDDYELYGVHAPDYIDLIGGLPSMPNSRANHDFWDEFRHVVLVQVARRNCLPANPNNLTRFPDLWNSFDIHEIAEAVHDEYPGYHQGKLLEWLWSQGVKIDYDILPFRSKSDFVGNQVRLAELNTWAIGAVAPTNFCIKWFVGRPRPEEVAWKITTGELGIEDGVPSDIVSAVLHMELDSPEDFTAYAEGCPKHPSWPAMHSAASSASLWLAVVLEDLTPAQYCEALRMDYAVSYARTVAGVHYPSDNIAGLNLGKEILLDKLADHLAEKCGSNRDVVQAKIESKAFDWAKFNPEDCSIANA